MSLGEPLALRVFVVSPSTSPGLAGRVPRLRWVGRPAMARACALAGLGLESIGQQHHRGIGVGVLGVGVLNGNASSSARASERFVEIGDAPGYEADGSSAATPLTYAEVVCREPRHLAWRGVALPDLEAAASDPARFVGSVLDRVWQRLRELSVEILRARAARDASSRASHDEEAQALRRRRRRFFFRERDLRARGILPPRKGPPSPPTSLPPSPSPLSIYTPPQRLPLSSASAEVRGTEAAEGASAPAAATRVTRRVCSVPLGIPRRGACAAQPLAPPANSPRDRCR